MFVRTTTPALLVSCKALVLVCSGIVASAQPRVTLPAGVVDVSFGKATRYTDASGKAMCAIVDPVGEPPVFAHGISEISYGVQLQPRTVKSAATQVIAPPGQGELRRTPCHAFTLIKGGFSQTLLGSTIARVDGSPLKPGRYALRITVDGQTATVPFTIK
jgi:hypothetical protein